MASYFRVLLVSVGLLFFCSYNFIGQNNQNIVFGKINRIKNDSAKATAIKLIIDTIQDDAVWPAYNNLLISICERNYFKNKKLGNLLGEAYNNKGYILNFLGKIDSALIFYNKSMLIRNELKDTAGIANVLVNIGFLLQNIGKHDTALVYYDKALVYFKRFNNLDGEATVYNNKASIYQMQGRVQECIASLINAMKIYERQKNKKGVAWICNSIGYVYEHQDEFKMAMDWYAQGLEVAEKENDYTNQALICNNIGTTFEKQKKYKEALKLHLKALYLNRKLNNVRGIIMSQNNIGAIYTSLNLFNQAKSQLLECKSLCYRINDMDALSRCYVNLAEMLDKSGQTKLAKIFADSGLVLSKQTNYMEMIYHATSKYYSIQKKLGDYKSALELLELNVKMGDSIKSKSIRKELYKKQYDYELKQKEELYKEREARKEVELKRQKLMRYFFTGGFTLALVLALFIYKSLQTNRKKSKIISAQKLEVEKQKELIEEKQKEIVDSITYAERIQKPLLAKKEHILEYFTDCFVVFKPKDIVSGDFYWATKVNSSEIGVRAATQINPLLQTSNSELFYLAVCDSTGHGVPGAFMSLLNTGFISEAIKEKGIVNPNEVFNYVRSRLVESISNGGQQDGFDGVLLCFDKQKNKMSYAAAHCKPIIISNENILELPTDKMPVGKGERNDTFKLHQFDLKKGDTIYLYTDGFADQFGGLNGKKFKYLKLKELLQKHSQKSMAEQQQILEAEFVNWRGQLEQTDDVTIIGLRV
jgi:serine phosphatase RsbU (regulator of sigma subunit)